MHRQMVTSGRHDEVAETATKPSPAPLQKHSKGGCSIDIPPSNGHRRGTWFRSALLHNSVILLQTLVECKVYAALITGALPRGGLGWTHPPHFLPEVVSGTESLWSVLISFRSYPQTLPPTWEGTALPIHTVHPTLFDLATPAIN